MKRADAPSFSDRVDRFLRWFLDAAPDVLVEPRPAAPARTKSKTVARKTVARRKPIRLRSLHSGPVRVAGKGKP